MSENILRGKGKSQGYKFDRGGVAVESGPYIGEIRNNIDPLRLGRVSVYIEEFAGPDKTDPALWRTVRYLSPFFGTTEKTGNAEGVGDYEGNQHSYGMWFTPPDIGTRVLCFFPAGKHNDGYYVGCIPEPGVNHMVPGIAGSNRVDFSNDQQDLFGGASRLPVTEINNEDPAILQDPEFYNQPKPVHSVVANQLFQQGLLQDRVRGTIGTTSQRETPSSVYGVSSPGRPVYQTRLEDAEIRQNLESGEIKPEDAKVVARKGGHSFVMDDGDLDGRDQMVRIRTARGHQITMSDSGDCFYITHANGKTWLEFGKEGTVDVYSSNSINLRTQGDLNLHADENVNINAGKFLNLNAEESLTAQASGSLKLTATDAINLNGDKTVGIRSGQGGTAIQTSGSGSFSAGGPLSLRGSVVGLNTFPTTPVLKPVPVVKYPLSESRFDPSLGWQVEQGKLETIVTRAPTHEPYPQHNLGVALETRLTSQTPSALPRAQQDALESVKNEQVDGIDVADVGLQESAQISLGSLDSRQVTGLLAQTAKDTGQSAEQITENGVGKFAFTPDKLEEVGILKPGSTEFFNNSELGLEEFLQNSQIWTGRDGATNIETVLLNASLQDSIQQQIMADRFLQLQDVGLITGEESPEQLAALVQTATKKGIEVTKQWVESFASGDISDTVASAVGDLNITEEISDVAGNLTSVLDNGVGDIKSKITDLASNIGDINATAASAQYAVKFITDKLDVGDIFGGGGGRAGTGTRSPLVAVDTADIPEAFSQTTERIIANAKVPPFTTPDDGAPDQLS